MTDPTGGWAEATARASEATKEVVHAGRDVGGFLAPPFRELLGMVTDRLQFLRSERQVRLSEQFIKLLRERGLEGPTRALVPSFAVPLIEQASLELDDDLQDVWARMLANAADAGSETEMRTAFVRMLADMTSFDVMILAKLAQAKPDPPVAAIRTTGLPENIEQDAAQLPASLRSDVEISLVNLGRHGCIVPTVRGAITYEAVRITELGRAFMKACSG